MMTLDAYQEEALATAIYPGRGTMRGKFYTIIALGGEAGEAQNELAKYMREDARRMNVERQEMSLDRAMKICEEAGDCLWYIAALAQEFGLTLEELANMNLEKLRARHDRP